MQGKLQLNDGCFEVEARNQGRKISITLDGKEWLVELTPQEDGFRARVGDAFLHVEVTPEQRDHLCLSRQTELSVNGHLFGIQFHPQRKSGPTQASFEGGEQDEGSVTALMPGTIFKLLVDEGQEVEAGDVLLILEAMKMENEIKAPISGRVLQVAVSEGSSVNKGQVLVQLGADDPEDPPQ